MLDPVLVPSPQVIEQWQDLGDVPIVETVSRSVPLTTYVRYPCEGTYERIVSIKAALPASTDVASIRDIDQNIQIIDHHLSEIYSQRSLSIPLFKYMEELKAKAGSTNTPKEFTTDEARSVAAAFVIPQIQQLEQERQDCIQITQSMKRMLQSTEHWNTGASDGNHKDDRFASGHYSDTFLEHFCTLLFKLTCLEQLNPVKSAIATDISQFLMIAKDKVDASLQESNMQIRMWILSKYAITGDIIRQLSDTPHTSTKLIFQIFTTFLRRRLEDDDYINPDFRYIYANAYLFFFRFYEAQRAIEAKQLMTVKKPKPILTPIKDNERAFYKALVDHNPIMLFIFELSAATTDLTIPELFTLSKKKKVTSPPQLSTPSLDDQLTKIRHNFADLSHKLNQITSLEGPNMKAGAYLVQTLPVVLHDLGSALNTIRLMLAQVLSKTPNQPEDDDRVLLPYEKSMLFGLKEYLNVILLTLSHCRTTKELIQTALPAINENITFYVQTTIQEFTRNKLPVAMARNSNYKDSLVLIFNQLRVLLGYIKDNSELSTGETNPKKVPRRDVTCPQCGPNLALLELMQSQLQFLVNPESDFMTKSGVLSSAPLDPADQKEISDFLKVSRNFIPLLQLADTLDEVCDQSRFFFREYYLDANKVTFFRVTTSLPMILSDYALKNYTKPELTGSIFYPLSIYDDAASVALRYLHSRFLYDEIKAEGNICLQSIIQLIADSAFHPIRKYASLRALPLTLSERLIAKLNTRSLDEQTSALRLGVLLSQNSLYLLGCHVQTKDLIGKRVNKIMFDEVSKIFGEMLEKCGVVTAIAVKHLIAMLKGTHELLHGFGLPLVPFEDILAQVFVTDTPNSLQSLLLINAVENITTTVLPDYALVSNPTRLVPKKRLYPNISGLHVGPIGAAIQLALEPTCRFLSLETFREFFWLLDDGAICMLADQVVGQIPDLWEDLSSIYRSIHGNLIRIRNPPMAMSAAQIFDRFEGAYRNFLQDAEIKALLSTMAQIGNALALLQLMDMAFLMKQNTEQQVSSFILSRNPFAKGIEAENQKTVVPELFGQFDKEFQQRYPFFQGMNPDSRDGEALPPKLYQGLHVIATLVKNDPEFDETSQNLLDLTTLNGFEAAWSVLEFLLSLFELTAEDAGDSSFKFGEGVQLCAAAILGAENQKEMHRAVAIGERVKQHAEMDFDGCEDPRVQSFLNIDTMLQASLNCALMEFQPYFNAITTDN